MRCSLALLWSSAVAVIGCPSGDSTDPPPSFTDVGDTQTPGPTTDTAAAGREALEACLVGTFRRLDGCDDHTLVFNADGTGTWQTDQTPCDGCDTVDVFQWAALDPSSIGLQCPACLASATCPTGPQQPPTAFDPPVQEAVTCADTTLELQGATWTRF